MNKQTVTVAPEGFKIVVSTKQRRDCSAAYLVLRSAGIVAEATRIKGVWHLIVRDADYPKSVAELEAYRAENANVAASTKTSEVQHTGAATGIVVYAIVLVTLAILDFQSLHGINWHLIGSSQAGRVVDGELWRVVTALTLHADVEHLGGNLVFGALFGFIAGRVLGGGLGWLAIVLAGGLGNWINAMVQPAEHTSIGASTAVFAALGIAVAHALRHRSDDHSSRLKRWSPLIAGVVLFGFTGIGGERTDVLAHVTGFLAGLITGWISSALSKEILSSGKVQTICGGLALALIGFAWFAAIVAS